MTEFKSEGTSFFSSLSMSRFERKSCSLSRLSLQGISEACSVEVVAILTKREEVGGGREEGEGRKK